MRNGSNAQTELIALPFDESTLPALARRLWFAVRDYGRGSEQCAQVLMDIPSAHRDRAWVMVDDLSKAK